MPNNYILLDRIELNATAASVTFDNIPQSGYTDLKVVVSARLTAAVDFASLSIAFNGSTASFTSRILQGDGSSAVSATLTNFAGGVNGTSTTANTFDNVEIYIPNYRSSNNKSFSVDSVVENNATAGRDTLVAGLWSNTAAITQVAFTSASGSFAANSTFSLYGLAQVGTTPAIAPKADGGNVIGTDGTYWYHAFLSNGTFTPQVGLSCDYLVVAGGGGGGSYIGGGGAGGLRSTVTATGGGGALESQVSLTSGISYTITVGAGGAGGVNTGDGVIGSSSSIAGTGLTTITSTGGGYGGGYANLTGGNGGSGGGGGVNNSAAGTGGTRVVGQGYAGGNGFFGTSSVVGGGGGGGSGALGTPGSSATGGAGGIGVAISAFASPTGTGVSNRYAGGGGGSVDGRFGSNVGAGGTGGGGAGSSNGTGVAGTGNTGGGGGAGTYFSGAFTAGGAGGSGVVIVRYLVA
jgi:hypothetical protein